MSKDVFLNALANRLQYLPSQELQRTLSYYEEMISDRMDDGMSEEEAVLALGPIEKIAQETYEELGFAQLVQANMRKNTNTNNEKILIAILLVITAPIWLVLGIVAIALFISLLAVIFSFFIAFVAIVFALGVTAVASVVGAIFYLTQGQFTAALFLLGLVLFAIALVLALVPLIPLVGRATVKLVKSLFKVGKKPLADRVGGNYEK